MSMRNEIFVNVRRLVRNTPESEELANAALRGLSANVRISRRATTIGRVPAGVCANAEDLGFDGLWVFDHLLEAPPSYKAAFLSRQRA